MVDQSGNPQISTVLFSPTAAAADQPLLRRGEEKKMMRDLDAVGNRGCNITKDSEWKKTREGIKASRTETTTRTSKERRVATTCTAQDWGQGSIEKRLSALPHLTAARS